MSRFRNDTQLFEMRVYLQNPIGGKLFKARAVGAPGNSADMKIPKDLCDLLGSS
jgi:hypothetical protein